VNRTFVVEGVVRVLLQPFKIVEESIGYKLSNCVLHRPIPLRVKVRRANHVENWFGSLLALAGEETQTEDS